MLEVANKNFNDALTKTNLRSQILSILNVPGSLWKTVLTIAIPHYQQFRGKHVLSVASSFIADQLLNRIDTAHSAYEVLFLSFVIARPILKQNSQLCYELCETGLVILNEILINYSYNFETVENTHCHLRRSTLSFSESVLLCICVFRQKFRRTSRKNVPDTWHTSSVRDNDRYYTCWDVQKNR